MKYFCLHNNPPKACTLYTHLVVHNGVLVVNPKGATNLQNS